MRTTLLSYKSRPKRRGRLGFTLVELLVVLAIVLLASLIALPAIYSSLNGRQITDAARIFSGALVGARDSAIRYNSPRGIRLLADPVLTLPAPGTSSSGTTQLCYNRMIAIEPAGDYSEGRVTIGPQLTPNAATAQQAAFPPRYPRPTTTGDRYPFYSTIDPPTAVNVSKVLMVEASPYVGGYIVGAPGTGLQPNSPTSWYWNIRLGDKIQIGGSGRSYTVVGPCKINPWTDLGEGLGNMELFVNVGAPGTTSPLTRTYYYNDASVAAAAQDTPEFLFVVNGEDDDLDGYTDEGWDGYDQTPTGSMDALDEWETETWKGSLSKLNLQDLGGGADSPSNGYVFDTTVSLLHDLPYLIKRRPVPTQGAREVMLPTGMVIDATTWNSTKERSRIPVQSGSLYCDIMVNPGGLYIPTTEYSSPTSASPLPFLHFWLTSREDVHPVGSLKDTAGNPIVATSATQAYLLPMPSETPGYPAIAGNPSLKGDRRLVTMFAQSGLVTTNTIENIPSPNAYQPGEGFDVTSPANPFYKAQQGQRETR